MENFKLDDGRWFPVSVVASPGSPGDQPILRSRELLGWEIYVTCSDKTTRSGSLLTAEKTLEAYSSTDHRGEVVAVLDTIRARANRDGEVILDGQCIRAPWYQKQFDKPEAD